MENRDRQENEGLVDARDDSESFTSRTLKRVTGTSGTYDIQEKIKWVPGFRLLFGTNHDISVKTENHVKTENRIETDNRFMLDFSPQVMCTLFGMTALWVYSRRYPLLQAGARPRTVVIRSISRSQRMPLNPKKRDLPSADGPKIRPLKVFAYCIGAMVAFDVLKILAQIQVSDGSDEDDESDASEIKGSKTAVVHVKRENVKNHMGSYACTKVGHVELGGAQWRIYAEPREHGKLIGFYLTHLAGSRDQIAFSMKIIDASWPDQPRVLEEEWFDGDWRVLPGIASDGKGTCIPVHEFQAAQSLLIEFEAHGPATKHKRAI